MCGACHFWCRGLVSNYSGDIGIYSDYDKFGKRYVSNRMLISVQLCIFACLCMVIVCRVQPRLDLLARFVLLVMRHVNTPIHDRDLHVLILYGKIRSLACGTRVLTRALNKIKQHTRENYTSCKLGCELYCIYIYTNRCTYLQVYRR